MLLHTSNEVKKHTSIVFLSLKPKHKDCLKDCFCSQFYLIDPQVLVLVLHGRDEPGVQLVGQHRLRQVPRQIDRSMNPAYSWQVNTGLDRSLDRQINQLPRRTAKCSTQIGPKQIDRQIDRQKDRWIDRCIDGQIDGQILCSYLTYCLIALAIYMDRQIDR